MEIKNFTITKRDGSKDRFSLDKIMGAICKAFENTNQTVDLGAVSKIIDRLNIRDDMTPLDIQHELEHVLLSAPVHRVIESRKYDRRHNNSGRPKVTRVCALLPDWKVVALLRRIGKQLIRFYYKPLQLITCYYLALFALLKTESCTGKIRYYWQLLVKHIKGFKIPALRTVQDAIDKLSNWRNNIKKLIFTAAEKLKYSAWSKLQDMIEELLPDLEPAFKAA